MKHAPHIAIVDDDPDDLMFICDALTSVTQDFEIKPFQYSVEFISYLHTATELPVLVVMDFNMPKMNAEDILIEMKSTERLSSVKAFILSTGMNPVLKERMLSLGALCCFAKPSSVTEYHTLAKEIIGLAVYLKQAQETNPS